MYCANCGNKNREQDRYCGICGSPIPGKEPEVIYMKEKPMESILDNQAVVFLTAFFFLMAIITIISVSFITKDSDLSNTLIRIPSSFIY